MDGRKEQWIENDFAGFPELGRRRGRSAWILPCRLDEAIAHFEKVAALKPDFVEPYFHLSSDDGETVTLQDSTSKVKAAVWMRVEKHPSEHIQNC
jgi:hypothetical protein